jgi:hypothetical protein
MYDKFQEASYGDVISLDECEDNGQIITIGHYHLGVILGWVVFTKNNNGDGFVKVIKDKEVVEEFRNMPIDDVALLFEELILTNI